MGRAAQGLFSQGTAVLAVDEGAGSAAGEGAGAGSVGEEDETSAVGDEEEPPVTSTPHASIDAPVTR